MNRSMSRGAAILLLALIPVMSGAQTTSSLAPRVRVETSQGAFVLELDRKSVV